MTTLQPPADGIEFDALPWNLNLPDHHKYVMIRTKTDFADDQFYDKLESSTYAYNSSEGVLEMRPATTSLNYGTTIWEGLKCYRLADGSAAVFRPDRNYERMKNGANEMCLPMPSKRLFLRAIQVAIQQMFLSKE